MKENTLPTAESPYTLPKGYYAVITVSASQYITSWYTNYKNPYLTNDISINTHQIEELKDTYSNVIDNGNNAVQSGAIRSAISSLTDKTSKSGNLIYINDAVTISAKAYSGLATGEKLIRCGLNVWDEEWEQGYYDNSTGNPVPYASRIRSKNPIPVIPNKTMYWASTGIMTVLGYGLDGTYKGVVTDGVSTFTIPSDVYIIKFYLSTTYGGIYQDDTCISFEQTEYVPANIIIIDDGEMLPLFSGANYIYRTKASTLNITYYKKLSGGTVNGLMPKIKLLSYNIRCLRGGTHDAGYDALTNEQIATTLANFKDLFQKIQPDVFVVCEDRTFFDTGAFATTGGTRSVYTELFEHYFPYRYNQSTGANEPHIYSKYPLQDTQKIPVEYGEDVQSVRTPPAARITVLGSDIWIVGAHPTSDASAYESDRVPYFEAMINFAADKDYVVMCGDFNTDTSTPETELAPFVTAGLSLGNMGYFGKFATYRWGTAVYIDNVVTKGMTLNDFTVGDETYSDHFPVSAELNVRL